MYDDTSYEKLQADDEDYTKKNHQRLDMPVFFFYI